MGVVGHGSLWQGKQMNKHLDDEAVDQFAMMMKAKMTASRLKGRSGWQQCSRELLLGMLYDHVSKGDMRDVAIIAMMIHLNTLNENGAPS